MRRVVTVAAAVLATALLVAAAVLGPGLWRQQTARPALDADARAEPGVAYRHRLYTHCGVEYLRFDGRWWRADPPLRDPVPAGFGNPEQEGTVTLGSPDRLSFRGPLRQRVDFVPAASAPRVRPCL